MPYCIEYSEYDPSKQRLGISTLSNGKKYKNIRSYKNLEVRLRMLSELPTPFRGWVVH
jgi:hypothetical protein